MLLDSWFLTGALSGLKLFLSVPAKVMKKCLLCSVQTQVPTRESGRLSSPIKSPFVSAGFFFLEMDLGTFIYSQAPAVETHSHMFFVFYH